MHACSQTLGEAANLSSANPLVDLAREGGIELRQRHRLPILARERRALDKLDEIRGIW